MARFVICARNKQSESPFVTLDMFLYFLFCFPFFCHDVAGLLLTYGFWMFFNTIWINQRQSWTVLKLENFEKNIINSKFTTTKNQKLVIATVAIFTSWKFLIFSLTGLIFTSFLILIKHLFIELNGFEKSYNLILTFIFFFAL